ncbi:MAG: EamA family transporter [Desulfovibrionaceae bacterium]|nr:EamA family transporter [Desulfovibrionaceae bacterium]
MQASLALKLNVFLHLFLVYISWGTTYVGLRLTLEVVGPFWACGWRMFLGGVILCLILKICRKWQKLKLADLSHAAFYAFFLVVVASGFLSFGQQYLPSGVAAIITGSTPISMIIAGFLFAKEDPPNKVQILGLVGGTVGLLILACEQYVGGSLGFKSLVGMLFVLLATFGWVAGTILIKRNPRTNPLPPLEDCGLLLLIGGLESLLLGAFMGEAQTILWQNLNLKVALAFTWMVIGGAILAYSSYFWLVEHVSIAVAVSYEYVVPVIALFFGWLVCDEAISNLMIVACALSIGSVFLVVSHKHNR